MTGLEWFIAAIAVAAVVGIAAALIYSRVLPVETVKGDFHVPLMDPTNNETTGDS
jgi:hypothetical protein